ncbi:thiamine pyrophosphate-binding protein [Vulcanisaeta sp. JCM 16159]|uniref:thiamine pyrophosphate-binding protein n=1 Tax=Vulcanisaeta sp. JCM 16159 TaxID=1295371 RepID=UPI0006D0FC79|nr:thiamine pyrophosphate-binding protein [Vulcanisaeta sp. JCM 16159]
MGKYSLMMGSEALVRGAIYAGVRFYAGYPITPATEIAEYMSQLLPRVGGIFVQTEDELAAINMAIGASVADWKAMVATSGPGFSLMQEGIGHAINAEVPLLIVDVQRGGPSTGQPTMPSQQDVFQARYGSHGSYEIIVLSPANVQELLYLTIDAINLSEQYRTPVILLTEEVTAHLWEKIYVPDPGEYPVLPHVTPPTHGDEEVPTRKSAS